ncbi:MAG: hypothetical protein DRJ26_02880 [Candidatus Methanomethylicota archaeon]|uniref:Amidinotransferase n=1 Tax=Thermoproteota archaeon TaxID=2056631 RepID=A0A497F2Z8_9CREN|nr:MAG: hypothetical protein DRJ26_02880 [Candidatus Verstraetearchaeota archaeon]
MTTEYGAQSEYGKLVKVIMHVPGEEINLVDGQNKNDYLFREVPDLEKLREEHYKLVDTLKSEGVQVILLEEVLKDTNLIEIIEMCPNAFFTRDAGTVTKLGAVIGRMAKPCRAAEPLIMMEALRKIGIPIALKIEAPATFEGGDAVWLDEKTLMIGYVTRTSEEAVNQIKDLVLGKVAEKVIAVPLTKDRVHLDGTLMIISREVAVSRLPGISTYPSKIYSKDGVKLVNLAKWLRSQGYEIIEVNNREDRLFGANLLCIGECKVLSYGWNRRVMKELEKRGFDVIGIEGYELIKAGGGLHCMVLPILRR